MGVAATHFLTVHQTHSPDVMVATAPWDNGSRPRADAIVTRTSGLAIGVSTADCGPILLADPVARVIGAAHAGWRGALAGIAEATIVAMEQIGADRGRIHAALGPMIRQDNYEVGPDLITRFADEDKGSESFFRLAARNGHAYFDLGGYIAARLTRAGLRRIEDLQLCTYAEPARFFSFRRTTHRGEADYGRHINAIALANS
jgi:YfiH family protein